MKEMKILSIGGKLFEVVDSAARTLISMLSEQHDELVLVVDGKVSKENYAPVEATKNMTLPVGVDANGQLFTSPSNPASLSATDDNAGNVTISVNTGG